MTFYESEIKRIRQDIYSNQGQIDAIIETKRYIDTHFKKDLNLTLLSHTQGISKFHLLRLFKRYYGRTPKQYQTDKRIERSKELLREGMAVTETCFAVGFHGLGSFSSLFKNKTGHSPQSYRKEQLSRSNSNGDSRNCVT